MKIKNGKLFYSNRFNQTNRLLDEEQKGEAQVFRVGETFTRTGILKIIVQVIKQLTGKEPFDKLRYGVANTALVKHNGKILALEETCLPFEIKVVDSQDGPFSLESVGYQDFGGTLKH